MLGEIDEFDFALALRLHMTVEQMNNQMSNAEYLMWRAYFTYLASQEELTGGTTNTS